MVRLRTRVRRFISLLDKNRINIICSLLYYMFVTNDHQSRHDGELILVATKRVIVRQIFHRIWQNSWANNLRNQRQAATANNYIFTMCISPLALTWTWMDLNRPEFRQEKILANRLIKKIMANLYFGGGLALVTFVNAIHL